MCLSSRFIVRISPRCAYIFNTYYNTYISSVQVPNVGSKEKERDLQRAGDLESRVNAALILIKKRDSG